MHSDHFILTFLMRFINLAFIMLLLYCLNLTWVCHSEKLILEKVWKNLGKVSKKRGN